MERGGGGRPDGARVPSNSVRKGDVGGSRVKGPAVPSPPPPQLRSDGNGRHSLLPATASTVINLFALIIGDSVGGIGNEACVARAEAQFDAPHRRRRGGLR